MHHASFPMLGLLAVQLYYKTPLWSLQVLYGRGLQTYALDYTGMDPPVSTLRLISNTPVESFPIALAPLDSLMA